MIRKLMMLLVAVVGMVLGAQADEETVGDYTWTYQINGDTAEVRRVSPSTGALTMPSTLGGKPVTRIGPSVFQGCSGLMSVTIPDSVTSIGDEAFSGCSGLTDLTVPSTVTNIGNSVFYGCNNLQRIVLPFVPSSVQYMTSHSSSERVSGLSMLFIMATSKKGLYEYYAEGGSGPYYSDYTYWVIDGGVPSALKNVEITTSAQIGDYAFSGCSGLTSVTIPDFVTSIGGSAFYNCSGLTSVTIPDSVTSIGGSAFYNCSGLTSVTIPNSVTSIGNDAFKGCSGLTNGDGLLIVSGIIFQYSGNSSSVAIPEGVTKIDCKAFYNCRGLTSVTIPDSVTSIGDYAFFGCSGLTSVTISDGVTSIGDSVFSGCSGLTSVIIPGSVGVIRDEAFSGCGGLTSVTISDGVTSIGNKAFSGCSGLTSVTIPNSVTRIGEACLVNCNNLHSLSLPFVDSLKRIFQYGYYNNYYYTVVGEVPRTLMSVVVTGDGTIGNSAFEGLSQVTNIVISGAVTAIGKAAFKGCSGVTNISIPDTVTSIGDEAFYNCSSLQHLSIPEGVTSYGVNCFEGCPAYTLQLYRSVFGGGPGGGSVPASTTIVQQVESPYALTNAAADRAIASVTVNADCAIDSFVLKDGKVYDSVLYIRNTADHAVTLTLPSGYEYMTIKGAKPLSIPANSKSILSITRLADNEFLVSREDLETIQ